VAKVRVYELAKEFGVESKAVMAELENMGEFVRSASSTIEAPVVRRLKEQFAGDSAKPGRQAQRAAAPAVRQDQGGDGQRGDRGPGQGSGDDVNGGAPSAPVGQVAPAPAPIAGDRRLIVDKRAPCAHEAVKERRFAHIGPADENDGEGHGAGRYEDHDAATRMRRAGSGLPLYHEAVSGKTWPAPVGLAS